MKRDISKLITLSFIAIISISIVYLSKKVKIRENIKNILKKIKYHNFAFNIRNIIPYLKNKNDKIEKELGI